MFLHGHTLLRACRTFVFWTVGSLALGGVPASSQTVLVTNAPARSTVELVFNGKPVGSAAADASGEATLRVPEDSGASEIDAYLHLDDCGDDLRRVLITGRGVPIPAAGACTRREIPGLFLVRPVSTLVIDAGRPSPTVLLRQGPYDPRSAAAAGEPTRAPRGLVIFGGAGFGKTGEFRSLACGNVAQCTADDITGTYAAGVAVWITPYLGAEVAYVQPADPTAEGGGETYRFNTFFNPRLVTVAGQVGVPIGPVRLYGKVGGNYHRATFHTSQTMDAITVPIDEEPVTIEGGTQTFELRTKGWGWLFGAGIEAWVNRWIGLYAEGGRASLKGPSVDDAEGVTDDRLTSFVFGARVRIGR